MAQPTTALSYQAGDSLRPEHRLARSLAKWLTIACLLQAMFVVFEQTARPYLESTGLAPSSLGVYGNMRASIYGSGNFWLFVIAGLEAVLFLSAFVVLVAGFGMLARGRSFRRMMVIALIVFAVLSFLMRILPYVSFWLDAFQVARTSPTTSEDIERMTGTAFGTLAQLSLVLLPLMTSVLLSRRWMIEALDVEAVEAGAFGVRCSAVTALLSGFGGAVMPPLLIGNFRIDHYDSFQSIRTGIYHFNEAWTLPSVLVLFVCSLASFAGGIGMLWPKRWGVRLVLMQARPAVVINAVNVIITMMLTVFQLNNGYGQIISNGVLLRLSSLAIDVILWLYLGSQAVEAFLRESETQSPFAVPFAAKDTVVAETS